MLIELLLGYMFHLLDGVNALGEIFSFWKNSIPSLKYYSLIHSLWHFFVSKGDILIVLNLINLKIKKKIKVQGVGKGLYKIFREKK